MSVELALWGLATVSAFSIHGERLAKKPESGMEETMKGFRNRLTFLAVFFGFMLTPSLYAQTCSEIASPACSQVLVAWPAHNGPPPPVSGTLIAAGSKIITITGTQTAFY